jgi:hypothetical protein
MSGREKKYFRLVECAKPDNNTGSAMQMDYGVRQSGLE